MLPLSIFVGAATQLVILPSHIPWIGQRDGIVLLRYSMICVVSGHFWLNSKISFWHRVQNRVFSERVSLSSFLLFLSSASNKQLFHPLKRFYLWCLIEKRYYNNSNNKNNLKRFKKFLRYSSDILWPLCVSQASNIDRLFRQRF